MPNCASCRGAFEILREDRPTLVVETHDGAPSVEGLLEGAGYNLEHIGDGRHIVATPAKVAA